MAQGKHQQHGDKAERHGDVPPQWRSQRFVTACTTSNLGQVGKARAEKTPYSNVSADLRVSNERGAAACRSVVRIQLAKLSQGDTSASGYCSTSVRQSLLPERPWGRGFARKACDTSVLLKCHTSLFISRAAVSAAQHQTLVYQSTLMAREEEQCFLGFLHDSVKRAFSRSW